MDLMANTLLAAGASPAMLHSLQEIPDFTPNIHALCVNTGTLTAEWLPAMKMAAEVAVMEGKPWVLDPVAAGASKFRLEACLELVKMKPCVIRGNGSEILALFRASVGSTKVNMMTLLIEIEVFLLVVVMIIDVLDLVYCFVCNSVVVF